MWQCPFCGYEGLVESFIPMRRSLAYGRYAGYGYVCPGCRWVISLKAPIDTVPTLDKLQEAHVE
jgi:hypothetical protein